jgi:hypothetical protein
MKLFKRNGIDFDHVCTNISHIRLATTLESDKAGHKDSIQNVPMARDSGRHGSQNVRSVTPAVSEQDY